MEWLFILLGVALVILIVIFILCSYTKAGPDEAIMISGLGKRKILRGKAGWKIPFLQRKDRLSLKVFQVDIKTRESIPTNEFININVDGVANLKISSDPELLERAFEATLGMNQDDLIEQVKQVLEGNMREIIGTVGIRQLVQDRKGVAEAVKENVIPDMSKLGLELVNFNIQNFSDGNHVIENLGIDNISQISKEAAIAKANADRDVSIARAKAAQEANEAEVNSKTVIVQKNTEYSLKEAELKIKTDTARANADAAYKIQEQKRQEEINTATVNAEISKREREVELGNKEVELTEKKLTAEINKKAEAEKYAAERLAEAELYKRQKAAEAELLEAQRKAEKVKVEAEAQRIAREKAAEAVKLEAEANKQAAFAEAAGIEAKGNAEAKATREKAEAMKAFNDAATLKLVLDSGVLPETVRAYSEPIAAALGQIDGITMYGSGNEAKLVEEIQQHGDQIFAGINKTLGIDLKSVLLGYLGPKVLKDIKNSKEDK
ncbi:MAG: SPFH domain-containing protein [Bacilli bacterium]|jgi:flotillin|nr:SPFH domain-containing protein [Bacilli bacterium]